MKEIKLTQGQVALIDDEDFEYLNQFKWYAMKTKHNDYVSRDEVINGVSTRILMHRLIMKTPVGVMTDHIDHNGLNNQKHNLRLCTNGQNLMNRRPRESSKYLGVYVIKTIRKKSVYKSIRADITVNKKTIHLGSFKTEEDAALAYNEAALKYHGEFANPNVI